MKLIHLADLHLGKRIFGYSMLDDQKAALQQVLECIDERDVDGVLIAGDVYDKPAPSPQAVALLDWFLAQLAVRSVFVCMISGNHDSALRLAYGSQAFEACNIHIASVFDGEPAHVRVENLEGKPVNIWMVPFLKPSMAQPFFEEDLKDYSDMFQKVLAKIHKEANELHILVCHQFFAGASVCESEEINVGTLDNISTSLIQDFDYAALGHIHSPQKAGSEYCRYAGTLLKYSISEIAQNKSFPLLTITDAIQFELIPVHPLRDLVKLQGTLADLLDPAFYEKQNRDQYTYIVLEDESEQLQAAARLKEIYPYMVRLTYASAQKELEDFLMPEAQKGDWMEMIRDFYEMQRDHPLSQEQEEYIRKIHEEELCGHSA